jgi:hypothetical protein
VPAGTPKWIADREVQKLGFADGGVELGLGKQGVDIGERTRWLFTRMPSRSVQSAAVSVEVR